MEVIVGANQLKQQVGVLQGILAKKETIPILSRIKIEASDNGDRRCCINRLRKRISGKIFLP